MRHKVEPSPTEALAARYRHLFVLPAVGPLAAYVIIVNLALGVAAWRGSPSIGFLGSSLIFALFVPYVISNVAKLADSNSIATYRRSMAVVLAGELLWLVCAATGLTYSFLLHSKHSLGDAFVFGAFLSAGFEFLVVNGVFVDQLPTSLFLGALHPLTVTTAYLLPGGTGYNGEVVIPGIVVLSILAAFTISLRGKKTSRGHTSIQLFQAFMKTWANDDASSLEAIIAAHSEEVDVSSKIMRFQHKKGDVFIALPGVHPGPFYPVGSYNLPGLISHAFEGTGPVLVLHRPGGHERNLATNADARQFSAELRDFAITIRTDERSAKVRGPEATKVGKATATAVGFGNDMLLTVSFAPYGSEDLELDVEERLAEAVAVKGDGLAVIDAHNSIEQKREVLSGQDPEWPLLLKRAEERPPEKFRIGYADSHEIRFPPSRDITTNGIALILIEKRGTKWILALADANNAVPGLRGAVSAALEAAGYKLLEFCTSDSHDLAARGLTVNRGYHALGETTPVSTIANATVQLAGTAESRLSTCSYGSGNLTTKAEIFGGRALDEFARITQESSRFSRRYAAFAALSGIVLLGFSLII